MISLYATAKEVGPCQCRGGLSSTPKASFARRMSIPTIKTVLNPRRQSKTSGRSVELGRKRLREGVEETTPSRAYVQLPVPIEATDGGAFHGPLSRMLSRRCYSPLWESAGAPTESCSGLWAPWGRNVSNERALYRRLGRLSAISPAGDELNPLIATASKREPHHPPCPRRNLWPEPAN